MAAPITHAQVLRIAGPIVLSNATVPLLGIVDTGVVGQLGEATPIAAVALGAIILSSAYWVFGFLRMGTVGLTAQAYGAGHSGEVSALLSRVLMIGFSAGLALMVLQIPIFALALWAARPEPEVAALTSTYLQIRILSAPAHIAIYGITGWLIALERTRAVFVVQVWMNGLNMLLNVVFVLGFGWGVAGVAVASVLAEVSALALALYLCREAFRSPAWKDWSRVFDRAKLWGMAAVNTDILIRSVLLQSGFLSFLFIMADQTVTLAANQILLQFLFITSYAMDGFAAASETLVGQAMGARNRARLRRAAALNAMWSLVCILSLSVVFAIFGGQIIDILTTAEDVRAEARIYLIYMIIGPATGVAAWVLDGIFIGATRTRDMRNMMVISTAIYGLSILLLVPSFGNHGLWIALLIFFVARGVTLGLRYPALEAAADRPREAA